MSIHDFVPHFHVQSHHQRFVPAPPHVTRAAALSVTPHEISPIVALLMGLRTLPARLLGVNPPPSPPSLPLVESMQQQGFVKLEDTDTELVLGLVGQFWRLACPHTTLSSPTEFISFAQPGFVKVACSLEFHPQGTGTLLRTETRVFGTDTSARRKFIWYWRVISPGSALIRVLWLAAMGHKATRPSISTTQEAPCRAS